MKKVSIPKKLEPLVKAFSVDDQAARLLIIEAAKTSCQANKRYGFSDVEIPREEIEGILALIRGIAPQDTIEMIYGAQIVSCHLMGLRLLTHDFRDDQTLGLKLLRFSNEAMVQLQKKRSKGTNQTITINYNYSGQWPAFMQTVIPKDNLCQSQDVGYVMPDAERKAVDRACNQP